MMETESKFLSNLDAEGWSAEYRETYERTMKELMACKDSEEVKNVYDKWACQYDKDMNTLQWKGPEIAARCLGELLTDKTIKILDVAAGSGLLAKKLKSLGFVNIDALDSSQGMLNVAKEQRLYNQYICAFISADRTPGLDTDSYDVVTCVGALGLDHVSIESILEMIRIVKPGGFIVIVYIDDLKEAGLVEFPAFQETLVKNGSWEIVKEEKFPEMYPKMPGALAVYKVNVSEART